MPKQDHELHKPRPPTGKIGTSQGKGVDAKCRRNN